VGRIARVNFRARIPLSGLQIRIRSQPARDWPRYLFIAWEILTAEMGLSDTKARSTILKSVSAAHRCVTAQNDHLSDIARSQAQKRIRIACSRIPNCINRAPAALRQRINQAILPLIKEPIDFEALEFIFETVRKIFEPFQDDKPLRAALGSLKKVHLSTLSTTSQDIRLPRRSKPAVSAAHLGRVPENLLRCLSEISDLRLSKSTPRVAM
jgi:hypothetical protein